MIQKGEQKRATRDSTTKAVMRTNRDHRQKERRLKDKVNPHPAVRCCVH